MAIFRMQTITDYNLLNINREIYSDYQCNCTKFWTKNDKLIIYKATTSGIEKIFDDANNANIFDTVEIIAKLAGKELTDKAIIAGGHTVINLKDRFHISEEAVKSAEIALGFISKLQYEYNKNADFLVPLNDFYMEKDAGTDEGHENSYRKEALNPYIIPPKLNELLAIHSNRLNRNIDAYYCSEKNMADRFKRHIKNKKKDETGMFVKNGNDWEMIVENERFVVLTNDKPNCVAGNAATLRAIRYDVNSNKIKDNYTSHVGIYPLCSIDNVINGYRAAKAFYNLDLPTFFVFCGKSCFDSAKSSKGGITGTMLPIPL